MTWIERKNWFEPKGRNGGKPQRIEQSYSIPEVAEILSVSRDTVYKWLAFDCPEEAVIKPAFWFRLPNGRIRIKASVVMKMQQGEI